MQACKDLIVACFSPVETSGALLDGSGGLVNGGCGLVEVNWGLVEHRGLGLFNLTTTKHMRVQMPYQG